MKIEPAVTWFSAAVMIAVGLFVETLAVILLLRHETGGAPVSLLLFGFTTLILGGGQIVQLDARRKDKPLDKLPASRHLAGPGRIWRPR